MRFEFIHAEKANFPIDLLCSALEVSRSGYYAWRDRGRSARSKADQRLLEEIQASSKRSRGAYGSPRIHRDLRSRGTHVGRKRVERLMRAAGLQGKKRRPYRVTTLSEHAYKRFKNVLNRQFAVKGANQVWAGDITYIATNAGWYYLAVVLDLQSRKVIGWAFENHMNDGLVVKALEMALLARPAPRLFHSDQGSQYASDAFQLLLRKHGIQPSMSRRGNCWDNAVVESFFDTLKTELAELATPQSPQALSLALFEYIEVFYNRQRLHSALDYRTPAEFERTVAA
ncbi:MAG: IS3 family transposase [Myxococcota bacterium]